jgi:two-component system, OmpR family, sensor histidine kinase VicK
LRLDVSNSTDRDNEEDRKKESAEVEFKTEILDKPEQIIKQITHLAESSSGLSIVSVSGGMQLVYNNFLDLHKNILDNYEMGIGKGIRWIISIDKDSIDLVKKFLELGMQIKHIKNMPILNFAIGDSEVSATIEEMEGGKMVQSLLTSNEPIYVQHFKSVFEELWKTGTDPDQRIKDIKQGLDQEVIETIEKPATVQELFFNILRSAKSDIMIILPTVNAFFRQEKLGSFRVGFCNRSNLDLTTSGKRVTIYVKIKHYIIPFIVFINN